MARKLRLEFAGAIHHVLSRGNRRQPVFADDEDRSLYLQTLEEACAKTRWKVRAYCLMPDHIHLVVETRDANLAAGMKWMLGTYAARTNRRHQLSGHLFSSRYRSIVIDGNGTYLRTAVDYVHLNPARARLLGPEQPVSAYHWSSFPLFLSAPSSRPSWLRVEGYGPFPDTRAGRTKLEEQLEQIRAGPEPVEFAQLRRGWYFGSGRFRRRLLGLVNQQAGASHYGTELREAAEARAERTVLEAMDELGLREADLVIRAKGDPDKLKIARRVREQSEVTLAWIACRLHMGARTYLAHLLYWERRESGTNRSLSRRKGQPRGRPERERPGVGRASGGAGQSRKEVGARNKTILVTDPIPPVSPPSMSPTGFGGSAAVIEFDPSFD